MATITPLHTARTPLTMATLAAALMAGASPTTATEKELVVQPCYCEEPEQHFHVYEDDEKLWVMYR